MSWEAPRNQMCWLLATALQEGTPLPWVAGGDMGGIMRPMCHCCVMVPAKVPGTLGIQLRIRSATEACAAAHTCLRCLPRAFLAAPRGLAACCTCSSLAGSPAAAWLAVSACSPATSTPPSWRLVAASGLAGAAGGWSSAAWAEGSGALPAASAGAASASVGGPGSACS